MRRTSRRLRVVSGVTVAGSVALVALALPASAHVTVHAETATVGATDDVLTFRVPNEQDNATVNKLEVQFPTDHPLLGVDVEPMTGWTIKVTNKTLNPPAKTDDGPITQAVSDVTWTADSATSNIPVGDFQEFKVIAGALPDGVSTITFKALQTYSNGNVVRWIQVPVAGQDEPDNPAPTLQLTAASGDDAKTTASTSTASTSSKSSDSTARALGVVGIVVGAVGAGVGLSASRKKKSAEA